LDNIRLRSLSECVDVSLPFLTPAETGGPIWCDPLWSHQIQYEFWETSVICAFIINSSPYSVSIPTLLLPGHGQ
jgi:hypothetical protein